MVKGLAWISDNHKEVVMPDETSTRDIVPGVPDLLEEYSLTLQDIACACELDTDIVQDALSVFAFDACPLFTVASVRQVMCNLLEDRGWEGEERQLWGKHDIRALFRRG